MALGAMVVDNNCSAQFYIALIYHESIFNRNVICRPKRGLQKKNQMEAVVVKQLPELEFDNNKLHAVVKQIKKQGVIQAEDLKYLEICELLDHLSFEQARKLMKSTKENAGEKSI